MKNRNLKFLILCLLSSFMLFAVSCANNASEVPQQTSMPNSQESSTVNGGEESESDLHFQRVAGKEEYSVVGLGLESELDIVIPATYKGLPVTEISAEAFSGGAARYIKSVTLGRNVTTIANSAFENCDSLTNVVIGDSVTSIGESAFYFCKSLASIEVSENNSVYKSIDGNLYTKDGKTLVRYAIGKADAEFIIPSDIESIGECAFASCKLTSVIIGDSVTTIGSAAFIYCSSLTSVVIPVGVTTIYFHTFDYCDSLQEVYYKGTPNDWRNMLIKVYNGNFADATRYYYVENEVDVPSDGDNYWHYNQNGEIEIWS